MSDWTEAEISRLYQTGQENPETSAVYFDSDEILVDDFDVSELNEILDQTFSLFDFDLSGSLDLNEFSQAHLLVQKYKYWRIY